MTTRTAVITIVHGREQHLRNQRACLAADPPDLHVVVIMGDGPEPAGPSPCRTVVARLPARADLLPLAAARNLGATTALDAGATTLVFLDVDCLPAPGLVTRYRAAARTPAVLCGPVTYLPPPPRSGYPLDDLPAWIDPHPGRPAPPDGQVVEDDRWHLFWSLSFALTARTWTRVGGFCERYRGYGAEDTDFALSADRAGARLLWLGGAHALHQHHPPTRHQPGVEVQIVDNARVFHARWGWWPMPTWLEDLRDRGLVDFDPANGTLRLTSS
ncbi:glycosyltransferase family 2 protein [Actinokineospora sp. G85]|uniref:glycosyltransferase family 2 protein n=1 Tax=Actinokineospora sp. G85 TaxID=3406626 RepID=UPI003C7361CA